MPFQAVAAAATLLAVVPHGNRVELQLDHGSAELLWSSSGTFRFRRVLDGPLPKIAWTERDPVAVQTEDRNGVVILLTHSMEVRIRKQGVLVSVRRLDGSLLMEARCIRRVDWLSRRRVA